MAKFNRGLFIAYANDNQHNFALIELLQRMGISNPQFVIAHYSQPIRGVHRLEDFGTTLYTALFHLSHFKEIVKKDHINFHVLTDFGIN